MIAIGHHRLEQGLINMLQMKFISAVKKSECRNQKPGTLYLLTGGDQRKTIKLMEVLYVKYALATWNHQKNCNGL